jgi:hypothetical protein
VKGQPQDWAKLIRKLHWIGMEDEACRLQMAVRSLPPDQRGTEVLCQPVPSALIETKIGTE